MTTFHTSVCICLSITLPAPHSSRPANEGSGDHVRNHVRNVYPYEAVSVMQWHLACLLAGHWGHHSSVGLAVSGSSDGRGSAGSGANPIYGPIPRRGDVSGANFLLQQVNQLQFGCTEQGAHAPAFVCQSMARCMRDVVLYGSSILSVSASFTQQPHSSA